MKKVAQVIGSIVYTIVFSIILYFITIVPLATIIVWFVSLSTFWKIVLLLIVPTAGIGFLLTLIQFLALAPYIYLLKDNVVAVVFSIGILSINVIRYVIMVWRDSGGNIGAWGVVLCALATIILLIAGIRSIVGMIMIHNQE